MFVRWKRREGARSAVLVESVRTADGPRQRYLCYLGSITAGRERSRANAVKFWESADRGLAGIPEAERARVAAELAKAVPRPAPARTPSTPRGKDGSSFVDRLPKRLDRDEESLRYLDSLPLRRIVDSMRFDDDAVIYHAVEPLMSKIREAIRQTGVFRNTESMGPFYRRLHDLLSVKPPQTWEACDGCAARKHRDGTCRKCKGCGYLIR
jgi:hypothetical protein